MKCKYFVIQELVDRHTYELFGEKSWWFFDEKLLTMIDRLREDLQTPIIVNNWMWGGNSQWRGLRTYRCGIGADYSAHRFGKAVDMTVRGYTADEVRKYLFANINRYPELKGIEMDVSWVHVDVRNDDTLIKFGG